MKTLSILALTHGVNVPSSRFRVRQHLPFLEKLGFSVNEIYPHRVDYTQLFGADQRRMRERPYVIPLFLTSTAINIVKKIPSVIKANGADLVWVSRGLNPGYPCLEPLLRKKYLLDVDDAVWLNKPLGRNETLACAKRASGIIAGNQYVADFYSSLNKEVYIVPTAVDSRVYALKEEERDERFVVGWIGTSGNYVHLYEIEPALKEFLSKNRNARLLIVGDVPPRFSSLDCEQVIYKKWVANEEVKVIQMMDVGIMPLADSEWTRGKCSFKMLQYMSCGVPVVVSPVGMNLDILNKADVGLPAKVLNDWVDAFEHFYKNRAFGIKCGLNGRKIIEREFDTVVVSEMLANIFKKYA